MIVPPPPPGSKQRPLWHVSPLGHAASVLHWVVQPFVVQRPVEHCELDVHDGCAGPFTFVQPYASHE
jgi:hypothetical protein